MIFQSDSRPTESSKTPSNKASAPRTKPKKTVSGLVPPNATATADSLADSLSATGATSERPAVGDKKRLAKFHQRPDSLANDSVAADSVKKSKSMLEAPVVCTAADSITYEAASGLARLYGSAQVNYQNLQLNSEEIVMSIDSSIVHAHGRPDSLGKMQGTPVFKQGSDEYKSEKMDYNFKTHKGFINQVKTQQGDGFLTSESSKRNDKGELFVEHGRYTTCDAEHPHFYISLSRAKVRPGKDVVFGPAYLVVEDVPLPLAVPYGFFPFSKKYSSGFIMPTYGDETVRGFYLRDGGYYFALSDMMDLKLTGEIYTKGSWGLNAQSNYNKRYRFAGSFMLSYLLTKEGEKNMPDYSVTKSFKIQWTHHQDAKANPNQSISASVNFASESYEKKNLASRYDPTSYTQSTRTSSVSYSRTFSDLGLTLSGTFNLSQNMRDSSIAVTLPTLNIALNRFYPFKRKKMAGAEKWYEKIATSYTGTLSNSISTKENKLFHSNLIKDWRNGMQHSIPVSASFQLLNYINVTPSFNFTDRTYTYKIRRSWDEKNQTELADTVYGFNNVYNYNMSMSMNTKLYVFYVPWRKLFGDKIEAIRQVFTPSVSFSYAPDFGASRYGYWTSYVKTDSQGNVSTVNYSPYSTNLYGVPGKGKTGSISWDVSNNVEMKIKSDNDSTGSKKISLIDELGASMSYNLAAQTKPLSDLSMRVRLKLSKSYTFSMSAVFATYAYQFDKDGNVYVGNRTEYSYGRFGRFQGMSQNISKTFNNEFFKKLFGHGSDDDKKDKNGKNANADNKGTDSNVDPNLTASKNAAGQANTGKGNVDKDGYMKFSMPWSFTVSYGVTMRENTSGKINAKRMRYPYKLTQTMNFSGNLRISEGWNINFSSGYDFNYHKISMTTASLSRDLHCCSMSGSIVLSPYTSYNFTFSANASALADVLKWKKQSNYSSNIEWY
jgi:hypothetical protein